ncbi:hypothetical protein DFH29DRAFT_337285 [Suillus ampliporus]|nr:hypothetical protein DFH29DRAFT_337285 [Suillus ampliporus]
MIPTCCLALGSLSILAPTQPTATAMIVSIHSTSTMQHQSQLSAQSSYMYSCPHQATLLPQMWALSASLLEYLSSLSHVYSTRVTKIVVLLYRFMPSTKHAKWRVGCIKGYVPTGVRMGSGSGSTDGEVRWGSNPHIKLVILKVRAFLHLPLWDCRLLAALREF